MQTENYAKANAITEIPTDGIRLHTKRVFNEMRAKPQATTVNLRAILCCICGDYGLTELPFTFSGRRPKQGKGEVHGVYTTNRDDIHKIRVYALTRKKQQPVASKTAIDTLLHEFMHYYDTVVLGINSIHCKGFYLRLSSLKTALMDY